MCCAGFVAPSRSSSSKQMIIISALEEDISVNNCKALWEILTQGMLQAK